MKQMEKEGWISCRDVLWWLVFSGFLTHYMLRTNVNIAIIAMVASRPRALAAAQCDNDLPKVNVWSNASTMDSSVTSPPLPIPSTSPEDRLPWNENERGLALGSYYWLFWVTQLPGGLLARRYGTKLAFGCSILITALLGFLLPFAARSSLYIFVVVRVAQGFFDGAALPSMHSMTAKWNGPNDRSRFVSAYMGGTIGAAIVYPLGAAVISWFGWEAVFYATSTLAVVWYIFWYFLAFDSPQQHPRISDEERNRIVESLAGSVNHGRGAVPWKAILTSGPVWIITLTEWGGFWSYMTLMTQSPTYFNYVHGWNIEMTGILSGFPLVMCMVVSYCSSYISDWLLRTERMSHINARKLGTFMCTGAQGIVSLALALSGCHPMLAILFVITATALNGTTTAGPLAVFVDLSPNYASVILGFAGMVVHTAAYMSPIIVGKLTNNNQTIEQWRLVFIISALMAGSSCMLFTIFGTSKLQPWNDLEKLNEENAEILKKLRPKQDSQQENEKNTNGTSMAHGE